MPAGLWACWLACWFSGLLAGLLACWLACWLACKSNGQSCEKGTRTTCQENKTKLIKQKLGFETSTNNLLAGCAGLLACWLGWLAGLPTCCIVREHAGLLPCLLACLRGCWLTCWRAGLLACWLVGLLAAWLSGSLALWMSCLLACLLAC